ncbi:MAG: radical SAM family heme chaperone HemW [Kofleriaceae bacterium]
MPASALGVYVHFPWCRKRCPYCDFAVEVALEPPHRAYLEAVLAELAEQAPRFAGRELVSVYLGGGTPSLWEPACVAELVAAVRARWPTDAPLEITLEANPRDCAPARLAAWRAAGVSRVSVGVQATRATELAILGRDHRVGDGREALAHLVRAGGFSISADLIVGVPSSARLGAPDPRDELSWIPELAASGAEHLSVYELTIEDGAAFAKRVRDGRLAPRAADAQAALYERLHDALGAHGYEHYEISSYARPGRRAVHNSLYWTGGEYLGLGVGAASYLRDGAGAIRWTNRRRFAAYGADRVAETRRIPAEEDRADRLWLGLRTRDGVAEDELARRRGVTEWLLGEGLAERRQGRICPTLRGFLFADAVAERVASAAETTAVT